MRDLWCVLKAASPVRSRVRSKASAPSRLALHASLLVLLPTALVSAAIGATIRVPGDQPTIAAGIDAAVAGDVVLVASGTYYEHDLLMRSGIVLCSETGEMDGAVIDALGQGRVMTCNNVGGLTRIEGFTFTGGNRTDDYGGGINFFNSSPVISRCLFTGNTSEAGGNAIHCSHSSPTFNQCAFIQNVGAVDGGALLCSVSSPVLTDCLIQGNHAQIWGGAMACTNSSPLLVRCTIVGNHAYQGAGIWCCYESRVVLNATIISSSVHGEGVHVYEDDSHPSVAALTCCDVYGNEGGNYGGDIEDQTGINGNISESPLFCDPGAGDFHLAAGSPCLPDHNECGIRIGAFDQGCDAPAGVAEGAGPADHPRSGILVDSSASNPFHPGDEISFRLADPSDISLTILDVAGRSVRRLLQLTSCPAGERRVRWDGKDDAGRAVSRGVFYCRLETDRAVGRATIVLWP